VTPSLVACASPPPPIASKSSSKLPFLVATPGDTAMWWRQMRIEPSGADRKLLAWASSRRKRPPSHKTMADAGMEAKLIGRTGEWLELVELRGFLAARRTSGLAGYGDRRRGECHRRLCGRR